MKPSSSQKNNAGCFYLTLKANRQAQCLLWAFFCPLFFFCHLFCFSYLHCLNYFKSSTYMAEKTQEFWCFDVFQSFLFSPLLLLENSTKVVCNGERKHLRIISLHLFLSFTPRAFLLSFCFFPFTFHTQ